MSANPQFAGIPDEEIERAFYVLLFEALLRADTVTRERIPVGSLAALELACVRYAATIPDMVRAIIARKAEAIL